MPVDFIEDVQKPSGTIDFLPDEPSNELSDQTLQRLQQSAQIDAANKLYRRAQEESKLATIPIMTAIPGAIGALSTPLFHPKTSPEDLAFRERHPIIGGIEKGIVSLAEGFTSPIGVATLGIGALPAQAQRAVAAGFAAQMASQVPEVAGQLGEEFGKPTDQRDTQKIAALITEGVGTLGMVAAAGKKGIAEPIAERAGAIPTFQVPRPLATIQPAGETYASRVVSPEEIPQLEVRPQVGEETPLRQQGEATGAREPEPRPSPEAEVLPQPKPQKVTPAEPLPPEEQAAVQAELAKTQEEPVSEKPITIDDALALAEKQKASGKSQLSVARELSDRGLSDSDATGIAAQVYEPKPEPAPSPKPAAEIPVEKEPWKMTLRQALIDPETIGGDVIRGKYRFGSGGDWHNLTDERYIKREHEAIIKNALSEGKSVPREVLADYPDLAKQAATEPEAGKIEPPALTKGVSSKHELIPPQNKPELQTPEEFMAGDILRLAVHPIKDLDTRSKGKLLYDISEWTRSSKDEAQSIRDAFVYSPSGTDKVFIEFPEGTRPRTSLEELVEAIKRGDGPGPSWLPIQQGEAIKSSFQNGLPVLAESADAHGIRPPRGYVKESGIYRRMDSPKAGIKPTEEQKGTAGVTSSPRQVLSTAETPEITIDSVNKKIESREKLTPDELSFLEDYQSKHKKIFEVNWVEDGIASRSVFGTGGGASAFANELKSRKAGGEKIGGIQIKDVTQTSMSVLSTAESVQINAPEGATYLQITQKGGGVAREPIAKLQKSNTFRGVDIAKVAAGHIGKGGKFIEDTGPLTVRELISVGPGAETVGEAKYSAIQQLVDQLKTVPDTGLPEKITARERIADTWAKGKSAMDALTARLQATTQSLKDTARGVRDVTELDRRVGGLDWALQRSAAMSKRAKLSIRNQIKDQVTRDAVAIWNDTPGTDSEKISAIQDTIANLPANTPNRIRRALQKATNLDAKARDFSESLRQYYGIRLNDAQEAAIFEHGLQDYYTHIWKKESNMPDDLRAALSNGRVSTYFEFARKRKFGTFLDGIRAGKVPELDPADVIPIYNYSLDRAIASRQFIRDVSDMVESDGRPTLSPAGRSVPIDKGGTPDKLIIKPKARSEENADYQIINHPALRKWKWAGTDENGNPILYQSDLLVHPNSYQRLSRMMDRSRLTPSPMVRALLSVSTEVKGFKLGLLSAFHAIHTGSHALFHWTNPFRAGRIPIDWESPATRFAVEKGHLKLAPDPGELKIVSEGIVPGRLVEKIPILGPWSRAWSEFQFGELIPRWKLGTFENAYKRNLWARDNLPGSGLKGLTDEQIAARVGDSVNNAFGELNKLFLGKFGRSPEMQRMLRGIFLAPDFGEARLRFVEKALTKAGFEERLAIATMFLTLYTGARVANYLSHGDPEMDWKKAFAVKFGDHWWSMRSVVGDLDHLFADFGRFMYVRLNPVYARTASDMLFGRDVSGRKLTAWQKFVSRPLDQLIPIQFGALTRDDQKIWESFVTAMGVQTQRDSPTRDLRQIIGNWKKASTNPKIRADWERSQQELFAPSPYEPLRNALRLDNPERAVAEYRKLREIRKPAEIDRAMQNKRPFTGSLQAERQFTAQMTPEQAVVYRDAVREREELYRKYQAILHNEVQISPRGITAQDFQPSPMGE